VLLISSTALAETTADVVCSYAPSQSKAVQTIVSAEGGAVLGTAAILSATGLTLVAHSSGAYILTGSGGYIAGTLLSPLTVPIAVTASVVVGGAAIAVELSCAPRNHPDAIIKVQEYARSLKESVLAANDKAIDIRDDAGNAIRKLNDRAIDWRDAATIETKDKAALLYAKGKEIFGSW
jgi:hypothetical protein